MNDYKEPDWAAGLQRGGESKQNTISYYKEKCKLEVQLYHKEQECKEHLEEINKLENKLKRYGKQHCLPQSSASIKKYETGASCTLLTLYPDLKLQFTVRHPSGKRFFIDAYDQETNTAWEIDEPHHSYQKDEDKDRELMIAEVIPGIKFRRVKIRTQIIDSRRH